MFNNNPFNWMQDSDDSVETYSENEKEKLIDYYGTAMQFFPMAQADLINLEEKLKNEKNDNDFNIFGFKVRTRRKTKWKKI